MTPDPRPRVVCFLDGANLYRHLRSTFGRGAVGLPELCRALTQGRRLVEWRYYAAALPSGTTPAHRTNHEAQQRLFAFIQRQPRAVLCLGRFQLDDQGVIREKGVDVRLAVDLVRLAAEDRYDVALLFSGDSDLVPAVETVRDLYGKRVELALPRVRAYHLLQITDAYLEITAELYDRVKR